MKSIKSRYQLLNIYQTFSGDTSMVIDGNPGYIYALYILQSSPTVLIDGDVKYWVRISEIRKRRKKIEKIMNKINGFVHN